MENNYQPSKPSSNLVLAILTTIFCCLPLGIVAIVKASQVDGHWSAGRYQEAYDASKSARNWAIGGIVSGIVFAIIYAIIYTVYFVALGASFGLFDEFADDADYLDDSSYIYDYDSNAEPAEAVVVVEEVAVDNDYYGYDAAQETVEVAVDNDYYDYDDASVEVVEEAAEAVAVEVAADNDYYYYDDAPEAEAVEAW